MGLTTLSLTGATNTKWVPRKAVTGFTGQQVVIGNDPAGMALQVAVASWSGSGNPSREALKSLHAERQAKRLFPLVVAAVKADSTWVFGPAPEAEVVKLPTGRAARVLQAALDEATGLAARQRLAALQKAVSTGQHAGVVNQGLFASHYLTASVPKRGGWQPAAAIANQILGLRHEALIKALGYAVLADGQALLLNDANAPRAVAVLLQQDELFDAEAARFGVSPVAYGLRQAAKREVPWLLVLRGSQLRLYPAKPGVGVGQKGQAETFFEMDLAVVDDDQAPLLPLVFSAAALKPAGSTEEFLAGSAQFAVELGTRLRARVYDMVIPGLARSVAAQLHSIGVTPDAKGLDLAYRLTMRILFRLLFQAYAEDRELLPYSRSNEYRSHSLKKWASDHAGQTPGAFDSGATAIWDDLRTVWKVIDDGNTHWQVPAYNGGLFSTDPVRHPEGAYLAALSLDDRTMATVLLGLLVDDIDSGGIGAVDFRSLSVREFGTIYEGLLESALSTAPTDLSLVSVKEKGTTKEVYAPTAPGQEVVVTAGQVYFHSLSGERKATGTYFTPGMVVEHLLRESLKPVVAEHLNRVQALLTRGDQAAAAAMFFDLRVADISMGSAHFLTAAIDHIEAPMRDFLTEHPIPAVLTELSKLEQAARAALGDAAVAAEIDTAALLRRQIARRCIYGLDINPMAVELARLAIWITTFVPGLPMNALDHNLVCGNSLTGVGTIDEAIAVLDPLDRKSTNQISFYTDPITDSLEQARQLLIDVANAAEATKEDVTHNAQVADQARAAAAPAKSLFDAVVAARLGVLQPAAHHSINDLIKAANGPDVEAEVALVKPAHFPYLFPEVFLRPQAGFDVILGNPPWEKLKVEEHNWWTVRFPGLRSLPQKDKNAAIASYRTERPDLLAEYEAEVAAVQAAKMLVGTGPYPGLTAATDTDLMAAFAWRFIHAVAPSGAVGVVLPRTAFAGAGLELWRRAILTQGCITDLTMLVNNRTWLFPNVHPQYTVALLSYRPEATPMTVSLQGPYSSAKDFSEGAGANRASTFAAAVVLGWTATAALPLLPDEGSLPIFAQMRSHPDLSAGGKDDLGLRPIRELHTTDNKSMFDFNLKSPAPTHTLPVWTGATFDLWNPDHGDPYAYADPAEIEPYLLNRRKTSARRSDSAFTHLTPGQLNDPSTLAMHRPRIAFRDVARATDTRTMICALVPPGVSLVEKAPYFLDRNHAPASEAYCLGVLSSIPFDWYARRFVELKMSYGLLNGFPVPRPPADSPIRKRVVEVAGRLATVDARYSDWGRAVGVPVGSASSAAIKADLVAELDALVALLYGMSAAQVEHLFATFHVGWDYRQRLADVLAHYRAWERRA